MEIIVSIVLMLGIYYEVKLWFKLALIIERKKLKKEDLKNDYSEI